MVAFAAAVFSSVCFQFEAISSWRFGDIFWLCIDLFTNIHFNK